MRLLMKSVKIYIFLILFSLTMSVSCVLSNDSTQEDEYTISYYILEEKVEHTPSSYVSGEEVSLTDYVLNGYKFLGWYDTPYFIGDKIESIASTTKGNLIFYGKLEEVVVYDEYISINLDDTQVEFGTPIEDVISNLVVSYTNSNNDTVVLNSNEYSVDHQYNPEKPGIYEINILYKNYNTSFNITVLEQPNTPIYVPNNTETLFDVCNRKNAKFNPPLGSTGEQKILVLPVDFTNYPAPDNMTEVLNTAFFGSSADTGWESLRSYYYKSSYGKLNITGTVLPVYHTNYRASYYTNNEQADYEIMKNALAYYDQQYDFSEYDNNKDGLIDAIYIVYSREPDYENDNIWWAYTYEYYQEDYSLIKHDNVMPSFYTFCSYEFLFEEVSSGKPLKYNMETFIHETGHVLGIDDYYDYDTSYGPSGGIGGGDMMDYNVGDHNPFTKAILGWVTPYLVTDDITISLSSFGKTGECIIIPKSFNGTYFDEYYIIDYYTPDGLNELEAGHNGLFSIDGVRIYHINASTTGLYHTISVWDIYSYNNSDTKYNLISLVEADGNNNISKGEYGNYSENSDLFQENDICSNLTWYNGNSINCSIKVQSIENGEATLIIDFK